MRRLTLPLVSLAIIMASCMITVFMIPKPIDPVQQAQGYYQLDRQRQDDQATAASRHTSEDGWNLVPLALIVAVIGGLLYTIMADRAEKRRRYEADANGHYAIPDIKRLVTELRRAQQQGLDMVFQLTALHYTGQNQAVIARHTAPPMLMRNEHPAALPAAPQLVAGEASPQLPTAPSFADLLARGFRPSIDRMLLGYGHQGPLYGRLDALLSTAIAGRPAKVKAPPSASSTPRR